MPVIVEALTDNPRRTVPEIRNIFGKNGGNMGEEGSVVFMFTRAGQIMYPASIGKTEDEMMEIIMEANADNLETSEEGFIITTKPEDFVNAQKYLADGNTDVANKWLDKIINDSNAPSVISGTAQSLR